MQDTYFCLWSAFYHRINDAWLFCPQKASLCLVGIDWPNDDWLWTNDWAYNSTMVLPGVSSLTSMPHKTEVTDTYNAASSLEQYNIFLTQQKNLPTVY